MKLKINYNKFIALITVSVILLTGCGKNNLTENKQNTASSNRIETNKEQDKKESANKPVIIQPEETKDTSKETEVKQPKHSQEETKTTTLPTEPKIEVTNPKNESSKEQKAIKYFQELGVKTRKVTESKNVEKVKDTLKDYFIVTVDFIFYGGKIEGITLEEFSDKGKEIILNDFERMRELTKELTESDTYKSIKGEFNDILSDSWDTLKDWTNKGIGALDKFYKEKIKKGR